MRVSENDRDTNASLEWELFNEKDRGEPHLAWRVSVRARRTIKPFEEIVHLAPSREQYLLH
jgi:hypothetical protein